MRVWSRILIFVYLAIDQYLLKISAKISPLLHQVCLDSISGSVISLPLKQAFVCGSENIPPNLIQDFRDTGLVHWLVVSGSHLSFLSELLLRLPLPATWQFIWIPPLYFYSVATGFQPPIFRAFISTLMTPLFKHHALPADVGVGIVGLLCLVLRPDYFTNLSFYLSWVTSLCLSIPAKNKLFHPSAIYLSILPFLMPLGVPGLLSIPINIFLSPFFGTILFPITLAELIAPQLSHFSTRIWEGTIIFIHQLSQLTDPIYPDVSLHTFLYFILMILLHGLGRYMFVQLRRDFLCRP